MRHPFIKKAKKNAYLMDLIDRYRKWKLTSNEESESDSGGESGGETGGNDSDTDWNMTVKGLPTNAYIETSAPPAVGRGTLGPPFSDESLGYSAPVNSISDKERGADLLVELDTKPYSYRYRYGKVYQLNRYGTGMLKVN